MSLFRLEIPAGDYEGRILADCANIRLTLPGGATVTVPVELATPVQPPLPEPTQDGTIVSVDSPGNETWVFSRREAVRRLSPWDRSGNDVWWWHDESEWVTWRRICDEGEPIIHLAEARATRDTQEDR